MDVISAVSFYHNIINNFTVGYFSHGVFSLIYIVINDRIPVNEMG